MSASLATSRLRRGVTTLSPAEAHQHAVRRRVAICWALLVLNTLTFYAGFQLAVPIPHRIGQLITQGALPVALLLALTVNRRVALRPNVFLCLASLLVIEALMTTMQYHSLGTIYRTIRFAEFIVTLWLLSPWWGRRDLLLVRSHLVSLSVVLGSVLLGVLVHPGAAYGGSRLTGVIWPIPATQVAHYAAITAGLVAVLWLGGRTRGRTALVIVVSAGAILLLTHTRTALVAVVAGIFVAGLSLFAVRGRARKFFAAAGIVASIGAIMAAGVVTTWLTRGQNAAQLASLTGRTRFWALVLHVPRNWFQELFGFGLSNAGINGLPIDSNWLTSYQQQGLFGVALCAVILLFLLVNAYFQPRSLRRALALFLVTYCMLASITEVGFTDPTMYLLDLTLAASLMVPGVTAGDSATPGRGRQSPG